MNIRNHLIEIQCNQRDVNDVAQAIVHSVIFFRTHGKFNYKHEGSYSIGTLGYERAFCDHFDFTYVRCSSLALVTRVSNKVQEFADRINDNTHSGTITIEFFQRRPNRWPFNDSKIVWEQWNIKIVLTPPARSQPLNVSPSSPSSAQIGASPPKSLSGEHHYNAGSLGSLLQRKHDHHQANSMRLEDLLSHKLLDIVRIVNSEKCSVPQMPTQPNLDVVFDTSLSDLQPYLHSITYKLNEAPASSQSLFLGGHSGVEAMGQSGGHSVGSLGGLRGTGGISDADGSTAHSSIKKFLLGTLEL